MKKLPFNYAAFKAVSEFLSKDKYRLYLSGVYIEITKQDVRYTASNGLVLMTQKTTLECPQELETSAIIPVDKIVGLVDICMKAIPKGLKEEAMRDRFLMSLEKDTFYVYEKTNGNDSTLLVEVPIVDACFPDYRKIIPEGESESSSIALDPKLIAQVYKAYATYLGNKPPALGFSLTGEKSPVLIKLLEKEQKENEEILTVLAAFKDKR